MTAGPTPRATQIPMSWRESRDNPGVCRWCRKPIDKAKHPRARTWHPDCIEEWKQGQPGWQRHMAHERDGGRCAACGSTWRERRERSAHQVGWQAWGLIAAATGVPEPRELRWPRTSPNRLRRVDNAVEYDHRVPLWAGGPNTLENIQTLCVPCHRAKTKREAADRAAARRAERRATHPQMELA